MQTGRYYVWIGIKKPDMASLSEEEVKYAKPVRVLTGETLYSHSRLEI